MKILVVDDDQAVRSFLCEALNTIGQEVVGVAENGVEAINLYEKHHPDIVFMDIDMPIMDGFDIIDVIRRLDPNARIVVITGTGKKLEEAHGAGAVGLLAKPFRVEQIERLIGQIQAAFHANPRIRPKHLTEILKRNVSSAARNGFQPTSLRD